MEIFKLEPAIFCNDESGGHQLCGSLCKLVVMAAGNAFGSSHLLNIQVAVTNPSAQQRTAEDVAIPISALRSIAPELRSGHIIVTATNAQSEAEDAATLEAAELPSQVDDLDGDNKGDELAFQIDLQPHQTRIVTITWGEPNRIHNESLVPGTRWKVSRSDHCSQDDITRASNRAQRLVG